MPKEQKEQKEQKKKFSYEPERLARLYAEHGTWKAVYYHLKERGEIDATLSTFTVHASQKVRNHKAKMGNDANIEFVQAHREEIQKGLNSTNIPQTYRAMKKEGFTGTLQEFNNILINKKIVCRKNAARTSKYAEWMPMLEECYRAGIPTLDTYVKLKEQGFPESLEKFKSFVRFNGMYVKQDRRKSLLEEYESLIITMREGGAHILDIAELLEQMTGRHYSPSAISGFLSKKKLKTAKRQPKKTSLADTAKEAMAHGMSYGQWVAFQDAKKREEERKSERKNEDKQVDL